MLRVEDAMLTAASAAAAAGDGTQERGAPVLYPDQALDTALQMFRHRRVLQVVSRQDVTHVLAVLTIDDVLRAYGVKYPSVRNMTAPPTPNL